MNAVKDLAPPWRCNYEDVVAVELFEDPDEVPEHSEGSEDPERSRRKQSRRKVDRIIVPMAIGITS